VHEKIALGMPSIHDSAEFSRVLKIEECRERVVKMTFLIFALSLAALLIAARFFTLAAEQVGRKLGLSPLVTGLVIVAIGTSLPELAASVSAARSSQSELISGNLIGSSLSNILLVLGLTALMATRRIDLGDHYLYIDLHFLIATAWIVFVSFYDGKATFGETQVGLVVYLVYLFYLLTATQGNVTELSEKPPGIWNRWAWLVFLLMASGFVIDYSSRAAIESLVKIAQAIGIAPAVVSMTLLSLGTTLPEAVVSILAARRGKAELAVGNILGSCIFNGLAIPGIITWLSPITVPSELIGFSLPVYGSAVLFFYLLTQDKKISPYEGAVLVLMYLLFLGKVAHVI